METKKTKKADISRRKGIYFNLGLVLAMALVISAFEWKSYGEVVVPPFYDTVGEIVPIFNVPVTTHDIPKVPKPKPKKEVNPVFVEDLTIELSEYQEEIKIEAEPQIEYPTSMEMPIEVVKDEPFIFVETMPKPEGGVLAFMKYLAKEIKYPRQARTMGIEGKVFVEFVIDETGKIVDVHTIKGIGAGCDEEAERVLRNAPAWSPGKQRGVPVKVKKILPIIFQLGN